MGVQEGGPALQSGARTASGSFITAKSSMCFNWHCFYLSETSFLSTPFRNCSKPYHSLQTPTSDNLTENYFKDKIGDQPGFSYPPPSTPTTILYNVILTVCLQYPRKKCFSSCYKHILLIVLALTFPINCPSTLDSPNPPSLTDSFSTSEKHE